MKKPIDHREAQIRIITIGLWFFGAMFVALMVLCGYGILGMFGVVK